MVTNISLSSLCLYHGAELHLGFLWFYFTFTLNSYGAASRSNVVKAVHLPTITPLKRTATGKKFTLSGRKPEVYF